MQLSPWLLLQLLALNPSGGNEMLMVLQRPYCKLQADGATMRKLSSS